MRKRHLLIAGVSVLTIGTGLNWVTLCQGQTPAPRPAPVVVAEPPINPEVVTCNTTADVRPGTPPTSKPTPTPITGELLTRDLPCAPNVTANGLTNDRLINLQRGFDFFSWLTFIALNSPADASKTIGKGPGPGGDAPTVWESYKQLPDVMLDKDELAKGEKPAAWNAPPKTPKECQRLGTAGSGTMVIHIQDETFNQPFKSGPLIDQNGSYALFVILMNRPMFEYIRQNDLYSREGQEKFSDSAGLARLIDFPEGEVTQDKKGKIGAIMLKASWKVLGNNDDPKQFHTITGLVYTPASQNPKREATCIKQPLGLVGFHIGHKDVDHPQWVWSTFEHVKNAPTQEEVDANAKDPTKNKLESNYNFYKPSRPELPVNQIPPRPWNPAEQPFRDNFKSQITRVISLMDDAKELNADFHKALKEVRQDNVWANYMLVSTQWPTDRPCAQDKQARKTRPDPTCSPFPAFLANTTLETFSQGDVPGSASSCIGCHNDATTFRKSATPSDFTFILEKAQRAQ
jgi:hypothetical protein